MKQQTFEQQHGKLWKTLEDAVEQNDSSAISNFPQSYRYVCHHLAIAKHRHYSSHLIDRLNRLVLKCHHHLYKHNPKFSHQWLRFVAFDFPQVLRKNAKFVWLSAALFVFPCIALFVLCYLNDEIIYSVMSAESVRDFESMYNPETRKLGRERQSDTDLMMFGFYIKNNIGISYQTFASGILFGIGSVFFLFYNGLVIGAAAGHMAHVGYTETFFPFVVGHGAFELTAIVFSGAAGLKLGFSLIDPGSCSRLQSLKIASRETVQIIYGTTLMLVIAAFVEAFWSSSSTLPSQVKYGVGALFWLFVIVYCVFTGRGRRYGS